MNVRRGLAATCDALCAILAKVAPLHTVKRANSCERYAAVSGDVSRGSLFRFRFLVFWDDDDDVDDNHGDDYCWLAM